MFDFGAFCYLDVQKTGSSFVLDVLTRHSARPLERSVRHGRVRWPAPEGGDPRLYFITCRDPVAQWRSLYFYGCDGQGALFHFLRRTQPDTAALYDGSAAGLNAWLARLLDPGFAPSMPEQYDRTCPALYGFQTARFLLLSFRRPVMRLRSLTTRAGLIAAYEAERLHTHVLRTESLNDDLAALIRGPLAPHIHDRRRLRRPRRGPPPQRLEPCRGGRGYPHRSGAARPDPPAGMVLLRRARLRVTGAPRPGPRHIAVHNPASLLYPVFLIPSPCAEECGEQHRERRRV